MKTSKPKFVCQRTLTFITRFKIEGREMITVHAFVQVFDCWFYDLRHMPAEAFEGPPSHEALERDFTGCVDRGGPGRDDRWTPVMRPILALCL